MGKAVSVSVCFSGSETLSMLATERFDVVISDLNMPGVTGNELLRKIRENHREMILVLITAYGTDALEEEVRRLGIGYITKPFEPSRLVQTIHDLIHGEETKGRIENASHILAKLGEPAGLSHSIRLEGKLHE
jgi:DNA-binding NtrC family response regulator